MTTLRLPGLIDVHVHMRQPGAEHKETWESGTAAALAGGFTTVLGMPNTDPAVVDEPTLELALQAASDGARCDYGHFVGAGPDNADVLAKLADRAVGMKMYLGQTYGDLRLDDEANWAVHLERWPEDRVVAVHAEGPALSSVLGLAGAIGRPIHICHVAGAADLELIVRARERGTAVTCEVTPHHLFLDQSSDLPAGRAEVRPRLGTPSDRRALWERLEAIDCIATDHAPHLPAEKDGPDPPPGFPGLETALPLLLTAVHEGRLEFDDLIDLLHVRPAEIYRLPVADDTWVEVDPDAVAEIPGSGMSGAGWTPFAGMPVRGAVSRVVVGGEVAYEPGTVLANPGTGRDVRAERSLIE